MKYRRRSDIVFEKIDQGVIILNHETGKTITLNETGASIWEIIKHEVTSAEIEDTLLQLYQVDNKSDLKKDFMKVLRELKKEGLLTK